MGTVYRKRLRHFDLPGHCHELTFSCFQRRPLLTNDLWRLMLSRAIDAATEHHGFRLFGFVYMPEHVHLLVWPENQLSRVSGLLKGIKQPFSFRIKTLLGQEHSPLLEGLVVQERPGKRVFRYWQEGAGYDRNLISAESTMASLAYLHLNPVRPRLVSRDADWRWSSSRFYRDGRNDDPDLPKLQPLPSEFWDMPI